MLPGEAALAAIAELITELVRAEGRRLETMTPEQRERWWEIQLKQREQWQAHADWWFERMRALGDTLDGDPDP